MEWQPIETAPKDEDILCFMEPDEVRVMIFDTDDGEWWSVFEGAIVGMPSHWMNIPEPPK